MKAFIDRIFRNKKLKEEAQIEENKRILKEQIETTIKTKIVQDQATEAVLEAIIKEADKVIVEELKEAEVFTKPGHYFADCNCFKCVRWRNQSAK